MADQDHLGPLRGWRNPGRSLSTTEHRGRDTSMRKDKQRWSLTARGRTHRVEVDGSVFRTIGWYVDDELVAVKKTFDGNVRLQADPDIREAIGLKFDPLGRVKRVTLFQAEGNVEAKAMAVLGTGGLDFYPKPGSRSALRQQQMREHPVRHVVIATAGAVAKIAVPLLLGLLVVRFTINLPWPNWNIPWPDITLPQIPWQLPAWMGWVLDKAKYVLPIVLAWALAKGEVNRLRKAGGAQGQGQDGTRLSDGSQLRPESHPGSGCTRPRKPGQELHCGEPGRR